MAADYARRRDYAPLVSRWSLPTRRPPLAAGVVAAVALVAVETLILYPLAEVAEPVSLGVVFLLGVLLISIVWGAGLGIAASLLSALAFNFFHIPRAATVTTASPSTTSPGCCATRPAKCSSCVRTRRPARYWSGLPTRTRCCTHAPRLESPA
jgi:K+-sensing histidine kinase KdpD